MLRCSEESFRSRSAAASFAWWPKGGCALFYFACLKDNGYSAGTFLGQPVLNLVHQPLVFSPPGLNICMTEFRGRYNLVISYMRGVIDETSARRLMRKFKASLLSTQIEPASR